MATYFVQKNGIYGHGVFWIGDDVGEGVRRVDELADSDFDKYHEWALYEYGLLTSEFNYEGDHNSRHDAEHKLIYSKNGER